MLIEKRVSYVLYNCINNNFTQDLKNSKFLIYYNILLNKLIISQSNKKEKTLFISIINIHYIDAYYTYIKIIRIK